MKPRGGGVPFESAVWYFKNLPGLRIYQRSETIVEIASRWSDDICLDIINVLNLISEE